MRREKGRVKNRMRDTFSMQCILLMPPGKNTTTITSFEPNLKQTLIKYWPSLFIEVETPGLLSYINSPQHSRNLSVLGQVGLTGWTYFCFIDLLSTII